MQHLPLGESAILTGHANQMQAHESRFGRLGELQTKKQKQALARANKELEAAGYITPLFKQGEPEPHRYTVGEQ